MKFTQDLSATDEIRRKLEQIGDALAKRALAETAEEIEERVGEWAGRHTKPGGTGALFRSIVARPLGDGSQWEIGHDLQVAPHALFVHWGTRPHKIKPKNKKRLRFPMGGKLAFAREVNHPGYRGDPWLAEQAAAAPKIFERRVNALLSTL